MKDYYKILGVDKNASPEEIRKAYHRLAHQHHPDKGGDEDRFKEINEAYQVLSDDGKRRQYDQFGRVFDNGADWQKGGGGFRGFDFGNFEDFFRRSGFAQQTSGFEDIFSNIFEGGLGFQTKATRRPKAANIGVDVMINLEEAFSGATKTLKLRKEVECSRCAGSGAEPGSNREKCLACQGTGQIRQVSQSILGMRISQVRTCQDCGGAGEVPQQKCRDCRGSGKKVEIAEAVVNIPPGIHDGQTLRIHGQGHAGGRTHEAGDLFVNIHVEKDSRFVRDGDNLIYRAELRLTQFFKGATISVPLIEGGSTTLNIPAGVSPGQKFTIPAKGMVRFDGTGRGDLLVEIQAKQPGRLTRKAKKLLAELDKELE